MAKRRKYRRYLRGQINEEIVCANLVGRDAKAQTVADTVIDTTWCSSVRLLVSISDGIPVEGSGPIVFGVAHSDYTAAEIEEYIENIESWNIGDLRSQEQAKRKIRRMGVIEMPPSIPETIVSNDGRPYTQKCNWMLNPGQTLKVWAYNDGLVDIGGTGEYLLKFDGHANLWPK